MKEQRPHFKISDIEVAPGEKKSFKIPLGRLYDSTEIGVPGQIIHGKTDGPTLFLSGCIHGDEINGLEVIRRVLKNKRLSEIKGTLIAIPIVNVFGFNNKSRYLPDRRDLNRLFPGGSRGSLGSRLAKLFMDEVVLKSTHGIDIHTGALNRTNMPQIRANLSDPIVTKMTKAFDAPVVLNANERDGSLRQAALELGIPILLYETGEALRFDEHGIRMGVKGIFSVMEAIGMLPKQRGAAKAHAKTRPKKLTVAKSSYWIRSPQGGTLTLKAKLGKRIHKDEILGHISDPLGLKKMSLKAKTDGVIIGKVQVPLVVKGDAILHVATFDDMAMIEEELIYRELERSDEG